MGLLAGCGRADYQYLESDDGHLFAKVPRHWNVESEGPISFSLLVNESNLAFTAGDDTVPWRAEFDLGTGDGSKPFGWVESQHIDARIRKEIDLSDALQMMELGGAGSETQRFRRDGVDGIRVGYWVPRAEGDAIKVEAVFMMDDRKSALYSALVACVEACVATYQDEIEEVLGTVTVKP